MLSLRVAEIHEELNEMGPRYYQNSELMSDIYLSDAKNIAKYEGEKEDVLKQLSPLTATWGMVFWEREVVVTPLPNDSIETRRARVISNLYSKPSTTVEVVEKITNLFVQSKVVQIKGEYEFDVIIPVEEFENLDYQGLYEAIEIIKPAHLDYKLNASDEKTLQLNSRYEEYSYPYLMCGTFLCGTKPEYDTYGFKCNVVLNATTKSKGTMQRYNMAGTFESGEDKV